MLLLLKMIYLLHIVLILLAMLVIASHRLHGCACPQTYLEGMLCMGCSMYIISPAFNLTDGYSSVWPDWQSNNFIFWGYILNISALAIPRTYLQPTVITTQVTKILLWKLLVYITMVQLNAMCHSVYFLRHIPHTKTVAIEVCKIKKCYSSQYYL